MREESGQRVCVTSKRVWTTSRRGWTASRETRQQKVEACTGEARQRAENLDQIGEAGQVCEGGQRQESLYNEQEAGQQAEKLDSK